jgi:hypothetical protein
MLRFHGKRSPRNYLGRREQYRLLSLFGLLALVVVLMRVVGRPESWTWLTALTPPAEQVEPPGDVTPIDTRRAGIVSPADDADVVQIARATPLVVANGRESLPGLRRDVFASVEDDTVLRGGDEHDAFFRALAVLSELDEQSPGTPTPTDVGFVQLFRQPEAYRGEWIRVRGIVRRALPITTPTNDHGIAQLHQLWLQPEGRPDDLLAIDVLQLPPGFPTGAKVETPVTIDGIFFKRWAYHAEDGIRTAPLILARTVVWTPEVEPAAAPSRFGGYRELDMILAAGLVLGVVGIVIWMTRAGRQRSRHDREASLNASQLAEQDHGSDVSRMLAELAARGDADEEDQPPTRKFDA